MKSLMTKFAGGNYMERASEKQRLGAIVRSRGTVRLPDAPRDIQVQSADGGVFLTWKLPEKHQDIGGWRVYINTESNLAVQVRDKGTRQIFLPLSSGSDPASFNVMISSMSTLGRESVKVVQACKPLSQSDDTVVPTAPAGYLEESAGGKDRGLIKFRGQQQYVR